MVCDYGAYWALRLRRTDNGPFDLPEQYSTEQEAIRAAYRLIADRRINHPTDVWFCLHPEP